MTNAYVIIANPKCVECGRPGYRKTIGDTGLMGHLDQRIKHPFRIEPLSEREALVVALAEAMLDAKSGASGAKNGAEQMWRTKRMADWIIARLPFHGLELVAADDGLTEDEREDRYMEWLYAMNERDR